jgi:hypothetical protein
MKKIAVSILTICLFSETAVADVCDYRPSQLIGGVSTGIVAYSAGAVAATGIGMKATGFYTLVHATTGATMLGSTATGVSAAGTTGIISGSAGILGTAGAIFMSPFVIIPTAFTALGVVAYEGHCYFSTK